LSGWGRVFSPGVEKRSTDLEALTKDAVLTRGLGRSYGDSSLPPPSVGVVVATPLADRILEFDETAGRLRAEAGLSLAQINRNFLARGWASPVLPGTQFVTLGGMVAADVHGKEHHATGCFGEHVSALRMRVADGRILRCSRDEHPDLFFATLGGMGLTGHILEVEFAMRRVASPWIWQRSERIRNIDGYLRRLREVNEDWPYIVGWIDCLQRGADMGRGLLLCGRWAEPSEAPPEPPPELRKKTVPFVFPEIALNRMAVKSFNALYYRQPGGSGEKVVHPDRFFHPLDAILNWNRIYGKRGFTQYQCVIPKSAGADAPRKFLERLTLLGGASFLCVIKNCGAQGSGMLSFPMEGTSIALDIAIRDNTQALVDRLNAFLIEVGGRVYLAKDQFTRADHFRQMDPRLDDFLEVRSRWDPNRRLRSAQSIRLFGDQP
jgi:FAD/FMN-containing dehydrogenase